MALSQNPELEASLARCLEGVLTALESPFQQYYGHDPPLRMAVWKYSNGNTSVESESSQGGDQSSESAELKAFCVRRPPSIAGTELTGGIKMLLVPVIWGSSTTRPRRHQQQSMKEIFDLFGLSPASLAVFLQNSVQFAAFPCRKSEQPHSRVYHLCMRQWALVWSFDGQTRITSVVFLWVRGTWAKRIDSWMQHFLRTLQGLADSELCPKILGSLAGLTHISQSLAEDDNEAFRIERDTRRLLRIQDSVQIQAESRDFGAISAAASWIAARTLRHRNRLRAIKQLHEHLQSAMPANTSTQSISSQSPDFFAKTVKQLDLLADSLEAQAAKLTDEVLSQQSALFNLIAQRDSATSIGIAKASRALAVEGKRDQNINIEIAKASKTIAQHSKRDSSSMKAIAVVTMLFLPGTFVASHFAMPLFDWFDVTGKGVLNRLYGLYWAVTLPLTFITCLYCWVKFQGGARKQALDDTREMKAMNDAMSWVPAMDM